MASNSPESQDEFLQHVLVQTTQEDPSLWLRYRLGALAVSFLIVWVVWQFMIGPREISPKTQMVWPATAVLDRGIHHAKPLDQIASELHLTIVSPDFRQLGGKLRQASTSDFGGVKSAVMEFQYGKSVFLLYRYGVPSPLLKEMKRTKGHHNDFYYSSAGAVSVVTWKDRTEGFYALAAKATEQDLLGLSEKVVDELEPPAPKPAVQPIAGPVVLTKKGPPVKSKKP